MESRSYLRPNVVYVGQITAFSVPVGAIERYRLSLTDIMHHAWEMHPQRDLCVHWRPSEYLLRSTDPHIHYNAPEESWNSLLDLACRTDRFEILIPVLCKDLACYCGGRPFPTESPLRPFLSYVTDTNATSRRVDLEVD
jgi:hypothetical protein